jgi:hypothetical protein
MAAKRKVSMAEKLKRRSANTRNSRQNNPYENLPPSKLDFKKSGTSSPTVVDPATAANQAKELLASQRKSVDMLTMIRERVEALPADDILSALDSSGYFVADGFLGDETILSQLQAEAVSLYEGEEMEVDTSNLGSGEYIVPIQGGKEQYAKCPRSVELVVSTTKHIPEATESMKLDASACMATLRTFDRKAFKASVGLLTGSDDNDVPLPEQAYGKVVMEEDDKRKLTLHYYLLPESWNKSCGGGLTFESGGSVTAQRDRLVILKSDTTLFKKVPWSGSDENAIGSCIELHLVRKA